MQAAARSCADAGVLSAMAAKLTVGTIRARKGDRHVVVLPDGRQVLMSLEGVAEPRIGADVIGSFDPDVEEPVLRIVDNVTKFLLSRGARIAVSGRSDVTATMLARLLEGTGLKAIKAGTGGIIERTPNVSDPDLAWALRHLEAEAAELGLGLNVVDPLSLAKGEWTDKRLRDEILPADAVGERDALSDLKRLIGEGFSPACRTTLFAMGRGAKVPSVDFILPFSPFATGLSFSRDVSRAARSEVPLTVLSGSAARRLSAFREIAKAFAKRYLGNVRGGQDIADRMVDAFADTAAAIAYLNGGGDRQAIVNLARLRECGLARDPSAPATHRALDAVLHLGGYLEARTASHVLTLAASIARSHGPISPEAVAEMKATASDEVLVDIERVSGPLRSSIRDFYRQDCEEVAERLAGDGAALDRMARYGAFLVPLGLEDVYDDVLEANGAPETETADPIGLDFGEDPWAVEAAPSMSPSR